jgi:hypothetical protein
MLALLPLLPLLACSDYDLKELEPRLSVSPTIVDFGQVAVGAAAEIGVAVVNSGQAPLELVEPLVTVDGTGALTATPEVWSLPPGEATTLRLVYTPADAVPDAGVVLVVDDSGLSQEVTWTAEGVVGTLVVAPESLDFGTVLTDASSEQVLAVTNTGLADVTVEALTLAGDTGFAAVPLVGSLPLVVEAGGTEVLRVSYAADDVLPAYATLTVDPAGPVASLDVPLSANTVAPNNRPVVSLLSPSDGDILSLGQTYTLRAFALDTETAARDLSVTFSSAVSGVLGTVAPDGTGEVLLETTATALGDDTITATVTDAEGATGTDSAAIDVTDCEVLSWDRTDTFDSTFDDTLFAINGDAYVDTATEELILTDAVSWEGGAIYLKTPILLERFRMGIRFRIDPGTGADGMAIVAASGADPDDMLGAEGEQLGVGNISGVTGFVIEIDVHSNGTRSDPYADHLALVTLPGFQHVGTPVELSEMENSVAHELFVDFAEGVVQVTLDGTVVLTETVPDWVAFEGYLGATAATGSINNRHVLERWDVETGCW